VNRPGFLRHLVESAADGIAYRILLGERPIDTDELRFPFGQCEPFMLVPELSGAGTDWAAVGKVVGGAALVGAAILFSGGSLANASPLLGISYGSIAMFGTALALGGISQLTAGTPQGIQDGNKENKASYYFNGPVNTLAQGGPVPIGIGRMIIGSTTIAGGITVDEIPI